ncbi:MAG: hypothetical protein PWP51_2446 [Clostridiales bacterium]|jgi:hypothetical protein|nr:hypothetical protein [Clostridiales bacterium]MDN5299893.1 hypothetical protein [Clostridiales bacterium]
MCWDQYDTANHVKIDHLININVIAFKLTLKYPCVMMLMKTK